MDSGRKEGAAFVTKLSPMSPQRHVFLRFCGVKSDMAMDNTNITPNLEEERPSWFVRMGLAFTLAMLITTLVVVLGWPELLDRLSVAGR